MVVTNAPKQTREVTTWRAMHVIGVSTPWSAVPMRFGPIGGRLEAVRFHRAEPPSEEPHARMPAPPRSGAAEARHDQAASSVPSGTPRIRRLLTSAVLGKEVSPD